MGVLFRYEMKKLLSRKLTWLLLAVCMGFLANFDRGMLPTPDYVRGMRDVYAKYEGRVLTDALAKEAGAEMESFAAAHKDEFKTFDEDGSGELYYAGQSGYSSGVWQAYEYVTHGRTAEKSMEMATICQGYLDAGCYENGKPLTQDDRSELKNEIAVLSGMPPVVHYTEGWRILDLCNQFMGIFPLFLLALCLTPLFSGERAAKMESVLLCAAKRRQLAVTKLLAASALTLIIFVLLYCMQLLAVGLTYGLDGAAASAFYYGQIGAFNGSTLIGEFAGGALVALAAMLALAMLSALFSAAFRNTLVAMLAYAAAVAMNFALAGLVNSGVWNSLKGPAWEAVSKFIYLLPGNALYDGDAGFQISEILSDPLYIAIGLLLSLSVAAAAAVFAQTLYLKRRKA